MTNRAKMLPHRPPMSAPPWLRSAERPARPPGGQPDRPPTAKDLAAKVARLEWALESLDAVECLACGEWHIADEPHGCTGGTAA